MFINVIAFKTQYFTQMEMFWWLTHTDSAKLFFYFLLKLRLNFCVQFWILARHFKKREKIHAIWNWKNAKTYFWTLVTKPIFSTQYELRSLRLVYNKKTNGNPPHSCSIACTFISLSIIVVACVISCDRRICDWNTTRPETMTMLTGRRLGTRW